MWTKEKIDKFVADYGFKPSNTKSEVKELPNLLHADEELRGLLEGILTLSGKSSNGIGLLIATNKRIIFFRKSIIGTQTKEEYPLRQVTSSVYRKGLIMGGVGITTANNDAVIDHCVKTEAERFDRILHEVLEEYHATMSQNNTQPQTTQLSNLEQLEKLFELKQKGIITEEEFNQQKAKLL